LKNGNSEILGDRPSFTIAMNDEAADGMPRGGSVTKNKIPPRRTSERALKRACLIFSTIFGIDVNRIGSYLFFGAGPCSLKKPVNIVKQKIRVSYYQKKNNSGFCLRGILNPG
jgi:hypothetical protein